MFVLPPPVKQNQNTCDMARFRFFSSAQAGVDPHGWTLPSSYAASKPDTKPTLIPNPAIFSNADAPRKLDLSQGILNYPDASHAAVHLALLECFQKLRLGASALDVQVDEPPEYQEKMTPTSPKAASRPRKSQHWAVLVKLAVARFDAWWSNIHLVLTHAAAYANRAGSGAQIQLTKDYLPPLDVLLVWYAFMQDTVAYMAACRDREGQIPGLPSLCFPWMAVRAVIDMESMTYELPNGAKTLFRTLSHQSADILEYLSSPPAYSEEASLPFSIDFVAEVQKHDEFIDAAHNALWIRSPALHGSLKRAAAEYMKLWSGGSASADATGNASFGVQLFSRTSRLFPHFYERLLHEGDVKASKSECGKQPQATDQESSECICWTCELIRDELPLFTHASTAPNRESASSTPASPLIAQQISSLAPDTLRQIQDDLGFYGAVEKARQRGHRLPTRPPTKAEKDAARIAKQRQDEVGYRPGINEYAELQADGSTKIRRSKHANAWSGLNWAT
ncbi:hypothetical protein PWT90_02602 [Aphanocladium album]|nr:hypothetical protein PWT90_02602 [Aphanocladium album]